MGRERTWRHWGRRCRPRWGWSQCWRRGNPRWPSRRWSQGGWGVLVAGDDDAGPVGVLADAKAYDDLGRGSGTRRSLGRLATDDVAARWGSCDRQRAWNRHSWWGNSCGCATGLKASIKGGGSRGVMLRIKATPPSSSQYYFWARNKIELSSWVLFPDQA